MVYVYLKELPGYCHEMVSVNEDGSYTIIINNALSRDQQMDAYHHAMRHIGSGHLDHVGTADEIERDTHAEETCGWSVRTESADKQTE